MAKPARQRLETASTFYQSKTYHPEETLSFLIGRCLVRFLDAIDAAVAEHGVTSQQYGVLHAILKGRARNPSELARLRFQYSAAITYVLDVLEDKGLLVRKRSAQDKRVVELELTAAGEALTRVCIPKVVEAQNRVLAGFNQDEYTQLRALLQRLADGESI